MLRKTRLLTVILWLMNGAVTAQIERLDSLRQLLTRLSPKSVEAYHKSLKQNAAIAKSSTRTVRTQSNHLFAAILAYVKMEKLKFTQYLNHVAIKSKIYLAANKAAFKELQALKTKLQFA